MVVVVVVAGVPKGVGCISTLADMQFHRLVCSAVVQGPCRLDKGALYTCGAILGARCKVQGPRWGAWEGAAGPSFSQEVPSTG